MSLPGSPHSLVLGTHTPCAAPVYDSPYIEHDIIARVCKFAELLHSSISKSCLLELYAIQLPCGAKPMSQFQCYCNETLQVAACYSVKLHNAA
jgi:hypothetical protein